MPRGQSRSFFALALGALIAVMAVLYVSRAVNFREFTRSELYYAEISREMSERNEWITPILNGVAFWEKPSQVYWPIIASYRAFGVSHLSSRLPSVVSALLCILLTGLCVKTIFGWQRGLAAAICLATSARFVDFASMCMADMMLTLFDLITLIFLYLGAECGSGAGSGSSSGFSSGFRSRSNTGSDRPLLGLTYFVLAALSMAGAVAVKGPIGVVLPAIAFLAYLVASGKRGVLSRANVLIPAVVFLVAAGWYFVAFSLSNGAERLSSFFLRDNLGIFIGTYRAAPYPRIFFFYDIMTGILPWSIFLPFALYDVYRAYRCGGDVSRRFDCRLFMAVWFVVVTVFLTLSRSRMSYYDLPCFPQAAALVGIYLVDSIEKRGKIVSLGVYAIAAMALVLSITALFAMQGFEALTPLSVVAAFLLGVLALGAVYSALAGRLWKAYVWLVSACIMVALYNATFIASAESALNPSYYWGRVIKVGPKLARFGMGAEISRSFTADGISQFTFEAEKEPVEFITMAELVEFAESPYPVYLIVSRGLYEQIAPSVKKRLTVLDCRKRAPKRLTLGYVARHWRSYVEDQLMLLTNTGRSFYVDDCFKQLPERYCG